jgi:hypothetical protein
MKASLGEAQAVVASRAEARNSLPGTVASLHCGASGVKIGPIVPSIPSGVCSLLRTLPMGDAHQPSVRP